MSAVVFIGPTITKTDVLAVIDVICLQPAAQGDVYKAMRHNPTHIGIIDGYFDGVAAVWHKEILWAMSQGVHVFGASSMGALRAAELADFGMIGVGDIFEGFRSGALEDDDEVAVIHGPAEIGYPQLCEPMVNIRATLEQAVSEKILSQSDSNKVANYAKSMHYRNRTWADLIIKAGLNGRFAEWLSDGKVNQKRNDAIAMLEAMQEHMDGENLPRRELNYQFEQTNQWGRATDQWDFELNSKSVDDQPVLDELRLRPSDFAKARDAAIMRHSALREPANGQFEYQKHQLADALNSFRMKRGLFNRVQLDQWLADNEMTAGELELLMEKQVLIGNSIDDQSCVFQGHMLDHLKLSGKYSALSNRAKDKQRHLAEKGHSTVTVFDTGLPKPALLEWFFCQSLGESIPPDLVSQIEYLGLAGRDDFYQLLAREYLYLQSVGGERNND